MEKRFGLTPEEQKEFIRRPLEDLKRKAEERDDPELAFQRWIWVKDIANYHPGYGDMTDIYYNLPGSSPFPI